jgi:hypothetical protein
MQLHEAYFDPREYFVPVVVENGTIAAGGTETRCRW